LKLSNFYNRGIKVYCKNTLSVRLNLQLSPSLQESQCTCSDSEEPANLAIPKKV